MILIHMGSDMTTQRLPTLKLPIAELADKFLFLIFFHGFSFFNFDYSEKHKKEKTNKKKPRNKKNKPTMAYLKAEARMPHSMI